VETLLANALGQDASQLAAAEKRDLLARLLGRLAHEIRNPLSSLDIHVQLLEEDVGSLAPNLRDRVAPRFEIVHGELHRLKSIVNQFLRLAGPSALDLETVEIPQVISHVCELLRPEAATRQIEIRTLATGPLPRIYADPVKLTQALVNLVINAMQAIERDGTIQVAVSAGDECVTLEVRDTGPGIPPERLPSIFDPYFTTKTEGHGLGLWIAQQIITAHGGTLVARNAPERGAILLAHLPCRPPTAAQP
jgi:two-component system sensor histidine kinase HydH